MEWNRVWAFGNNTYLRLYPNFGVGFCVGKYRCALSWHRGFEVFSLIHKRENGNKVQHWVLRMRRWNRKLDTKRWS